MSKTTYIFSVFILCLAYQVSTQATQSNLISVTGRGEIRIPPDRVRISVGVEARQENVKQAGTETNVKAANIIAYLKNQGIDPRDIQTSFVSLQPYFAYNAYEGQSAKASYYISQKTITFVLKKLSNYDSVMSGLYEMGVNSVSGTSFEVSNLEDYREEARRLAVQNAQNVASTLARSLGVKVGSVYSISDNLSGGQQGGTYYQEAKAYDTGIASSGPSIAGGEVVISYSVSANFHIN